MKRAILCTGILGGGTAIVFALALTVSVLFPQGALVQASWNGGFRNFAPMPAMGGGIMVDDVMTKDVFVAAPDVVAVPAPAPPIEVPASIESPGPGG